MSKFWETKEWLELKVPKLKTNRLLTRVEYLRFIGHENYNEERYKVYLKAMQEKNDSLFNQAISEGK